MKILTQKAMTLFELLAVIVILGIVAAIGFPTVSKIIDNSRKDAFIADITNFVAAAKTEALTYGEDTTEDKKFEYDVATDKVTLGFDSSFTLTEGQIEVVIEDGLVTGIYLRKAFQSERFTLKNTVVVAEDDTAFDFAGVKKLTRDDLDKA